MMDKTALTTASPFGQDRPQELIRVFDAARRFVGYREKVASLNAGLLATPATLADAIDRDFLAFDLETAARELRDAVLAIDPLMAILNPATGAAAQAGSLRQDN